MSAAHTDGSAELGLLDHVTIKVRDLKASRVFYEPVLATLGCGVLLEAEGRVVGFGRPPRIMFEIAQAGGAAPLSSAVHVAFAAASEDAVRAFHAAALAHGATDNGPPGLRPHYEPGYFAAFAIDPDGHNLEAVFHAHAERPGDSGPAAEPPASAPRTGDQA